MNFPNTILMFVFDVGIIAACVIATLVIGRQWSKLVEMRARTSAILVLSGIWAQSSVYVADLYTMTLLTYFRGPEFAHQYMISVHTNYAWYASATFNIFSLPQV